MPTPRPRPRDADSLRSKQEIERICSRNLFASSEERLFFKDLESRFLLVSEGFVNALGQGRSLDEVLGKTDFDIFSKPHASEAYEDEQQIIRTGEPIVGKIERETFENAPDRWVATTKLPLRDDGGRIIGTFGISRDVTAQIEAQEALAHQALHDPLTGLANRVALMDRLRQALIALERRGGLVAVLFIDLDNFKTINDSLSHEIGDRVLVEAGSRIRRAARRSDTAARFGGDEFVVLCPALRDDADVNVLSTRVLEALRQPLKNAPGMSLTGSVGAALTPDPMCDPGHLLQQADFAMYAAKRAGRNRFETYDGELHGLVAHSLTKT
jgi:diguanylate cyclase (GGDEF)-like protein/PAS domain S-box-containing protein